METRTLFIGTPPAIDTDHASRPKVATSETTYPFVNLSKLSPRYGDQSPSRDTARFTLPGRMGAARAVPAFGDGRRRQGRYECNLGETFVRLGSPDV